MGTYGNLEKEIPFPLMAWVWSPELEMKIPYK
jgi:hypothetical protein